MSGDLVLITGATGLVGFGVLRAALEHGYRLRAAVRSEQKAEIIRSNPTLKGISEEQLSFVIVPDILADGAFDEAVKGVKFILHVASPVPRLDLTGYDDLDAEIVQPAIQGTVGIFKSAQKAGGVQRIVVTSSGAALVPMSAFTGTTDEVVGPDSRGEPLPSPYMNNAQIAYNASKIHALKHAEDFIATEQPGFDAVHIHPVIVLGRNELALKAAEVDNGSLSFAIGPVIGRHHPTPFPLTVTSLTSVALAHVRALDPKVPGNQSYLLANKGDEGYHVSVPSSIESNSRN